MASEHETNPTHPSRAARWGPWKLMPAGEVLSPPVKVLFLHGFGTSPRELKPLGEALARRGFEVMAPLLPGHGEYYSGMNSCELVDWLEAVRLCYEALHRDGTAVALVGYCLGGCLGLTLASELNPWALICLSTPHQPYPDLFFPKVESDEGEFVLHSTDRLVHACRSAKATSWRALGAHATVTESFLSLYQKAIKTSAERLSEIRCPTLVVNGEKDDILGPRQGQDLLRQLEQCEQKRHLTAAQAAHAVPIDLGRRLVFAEVADFLSSVRPVERQTF